jgi:hypothetical protein
MQVNTVTSVLGCRLVFAIFFRILNQSVSPISGGKLLFPGDTASVTGAVVYGETRPQRDIPWILGNVLSATPDIHFSD